MLRIFAQKHLAAMKRNRNLAEIIHIELRQSDRLVKEYRNQTFREYLDLISWIIEQGQKENIYRQDILPDIAKRVFFGALDEVSRVWTDQDSPSYTLEQTTEQVLEIFMSGFVSPDQ